VPLCAIGRCPEKYIRWTYRNAFKFRGCDRFYTKKIKTRIES